MPVYRRITITVLLSIGILAIGESAAAQHSGSLFLAGYKFEESVPTSASGDLFFTLHGDTLQVKGSFDDLSSPYSSAGIFFGKKGERGNRVFKLDAQLEEDGTSGVFLAEENLFTLTESQKEYLLEGSLYVSLQTSKFPRGEIRGQFPGKD